MFRILTRIPIQTSKCLIHSVPMNKRMTIFVDQALVRRFTTESTKKTIQECLQKSEHTMNSTISKSSVGTESIQKKVIQETVSKCESTNAATSTIKETVSTPIVNTTKESVNQETVNKSKKVLSVPQKWAFSFGIGLFASGLGSMVGLGGGFIMIPMLTGFFGATQHLAQGTSLAAIVLTGFTSAVTYYQNDAVDIPAALVLTCSAMILSRFSARYTGHFDSKKLKKIFGWFSILISPTVPLKTYLMNYKKKQEEALALKESSTPVQTTAAVATATAIASTSSTTVVDAAKNVNEEQTSVWKKMIQNSIVGEHWKTMLGTGVFSGAISGFFGVGGGSIITPALCLLTNLPQQKVVGTTLASVVIPSLTGAITHYRLGNMMTPILIPLMSGTILGGYIGPKIAMKCDQEKLRYLFMIILMLSGLKSIL